MPYELCRHIKTNGRRCHSPALTGEFWCYFHNRLTFRERQLRATKPKAQEAAFTLPALVDREACQVSVSLLAEAILTGRVDDKRAALLLRAIQLASRNIGVDDTLYIGPQSREPVMSFTPTPDGLNLAPRTMSDNSAPPKLSPTASQEIASPAESTT